jgi:hypothetical protein
MLPLPYADERRRPPVPVTVETTPNPRARKFTVGVPVGGPATFTAQTAGDRAEWMGIILELTGVVSLFLTSDFVTVTGDDTVDWAAITPDIVSALEREF